MASRLSHLPTLIDVDYGLEVYRPSSLIRVEHEPPQRIYDTARKLWLDHEGAIIMRYERSNAEIGRVGFGGGIRRA